MLKGPTTIALVASVLSCASINAATDLPHSGDKSQEEGPLRLGHTVIPLSYDISLALDPRKARFSGEVSIKVRLRKKTRYIFLHGLDLNVTRAYLTTADGRRVVGTYEQVSALGAAQVALAAQVTAQDAVLTFVYDAPFNEHLVGLYKVVQGQETYAFTQFESTHARRCFPSFDDPGFKTPFTIRVIVNPRDEVFSGSPMAHKETLPNGNKQVTFRPTPPLPTYLVALVVGPIDVVDGGNIPPNGIRERPIPLRGLAPRGRGQDLAYALQHTGALLGALEAYLGVPYPYAKLDLVAVPDFSAGAMENVGLITFREWLLLLDENASVAQRHRFAEVMAHELAHQWFGNYVTMAWWDDVWLNEAFATWLSTKAVATVFSTFRVDLPALERTLWAMAEDSLASARRIHEPIASEHDIHNSFDPITYLKGAAVLGSIAGFAGEQAFNATLRRYLRDNAWGHGTTARFLRALAQEAGDEAAEVLAGYLENPGVPLVRITPTCTDGGHYLATEVTRYNPLGKELSGQGGAAKASAETPPWRLPFCVRYGFDGTNEGADVEVCAAITAATQKLPLPGSTCPAWVMPNVGGRGYYRFELPEQALAALRQHGIEALAPTEQRMYADSVVSGFQRGSLSLAATIAAIMPLAASHHREVAQAPMALLRFVDEYLLPDFGANTLAGLAKRSYAKSLRYLGLDGRTDARPPLFGTSEEDTLFRVELAAFLADVGKQKDVRDELAERGSAFVGFRADDRLHLETIALDMAPLAVRLAADGEGAPFVRAVSRLLQTDLAPAIRAALIKGIGGTVDPQAAAQVRQLILAPQLRHNERTALLRALIERSANRDATWRWLQENYDALVEILPQGHRGKLPRLGDVLCTPEAQQTLQEFFVPRVATLVGGPRNLQLAAENVAICSAIRKRHEAAAQRYFASETPAGGAPARPDDPGAGSWH